MKTQNPFLTPLYDLGLVQITESEVKMLDSSEKVSDWEPRTTKHSALDSNEDSKSSSSSVINETRCETKKTCADCGTNKTPLWRSGTAGPKTLCNACGIRSRKKSRAMIAAATAGGGLKDKKPRKGSSGGNQNRNSKIGDSLKQRLMELEREVMIQRSTVKQRWKLGEEEQAAIILMALSYG